MTRKMDEWTAREIADAVRFMASSCPLCGSPAVRECTKFCCSRLNDPECQMGGWLRTLDDWNHRCPKKATLGQLAGWIAQAISMTLSAISKAHQTKESAK